jgi:hypothetical protein
VRHQALAAGQGKPTATGPLQSATLTLTLTTPDAVIHVVLKGVVQTLIGYGACGANLLRFNHTRTVTGEKHLGWEVATLAV